jgi:hypothetical protein
VSLTAFCFLVIDADTLVLDTKEKPYACHCGAAFTRRDLLARHQRLQSHKQDALPDTSPTADADLAAAVSLSGLSSADPWIGQQLQLSTHRVGDEGNMGRQDYTQSILSSQLFDDAPPTPTSPNITSSDNVIFDPHFAEFASFLDGVGLPAVWSPFFSGPFEKDNELADAISTYSHEDTPSPRTGNRQRAGTPFSSWLPSAPTGNRIVNHAAESRKPFPLFHES